MLHRLQCGKTCNNIHQKRINNSLLAQLVAIDHFAILHLREYSKIRLALQSLKTAIINKYPFHNLRKYLYIKNLFLWMQRNWS